MKAADADGPNRSVRDLLKDAELEPQPLPVVHSRDLAMVSTFMPDHGSAGLAYSVQTYANSIGIEAKQRKEFLERRLSVQNLGLAALQRAGWASIIPIAYDSLSGGDPLFDFRSSGLPSNAIFGNPTFDLLNGLAGTPAMAAKLLADRDYEFSQQSHEAQ